MTMETQPYETQLVLIEIAEATREIDLRRLRDLVDDQLAAQERARWELYRYLDDLWAQLKSSGELHAMAPRVLQGLAGLRDVTGSLCAATDCLKLRTAD